MRALAAAALAGGIHPPIDHPHRHHPPHKQARAAYDEAAGSGGEGWWESFSDRVACSWDAAKCRMKEGLGLSAVSSSTDYSWHACCALCGRLGGWCCASCSVWQL